MGHVDSTGFGIHSGCGGWEAYLNFTDEHAQFDHRQFFILCAWSRKFDVRIYFFCINLLLITVNPCSSMVILAFFNSKLAGHNPCEASKGSARGTSRRGVCCVSEHKARLHLPASATLD